MQTRTIRVWVVGTAQAVKGLVFMRTFRFFWHRAWKQNCYGKTGNKFILVALCEDSDYFWHRAC